MLLKVLKAVLATFLFAVVIIPQNSPQSTPIMLAGDDPGGGTGGG